MDVSQSILNWELKALKLRKRMRETSGAELSRASTDLDTVEKHLERLRSHAGYLAYK